MPALQLSSFSHYLITLEGRFDTAFLMWDRAGHVSRGLERRISGVKLVNATPASVILSIKEKYDVGYSPSNLSITQYYPDRDALSFREDADKLVQTVVENFELQEFTRVGFRMIFSREYPSEEAASRDFVSAGLLKTPTGNVFNINGRIALPEYAVQWKDEEHTLLARLRVQTDKVELEPPKNVKDIERISKEHNRLLFDVDYFTIGAIPVGRFRASAFIDQARHLINRDSHHFLGG
jgi:hypothetical protein